MKIGLRTRRLMFSAVVAALAAPPVLAVEGLDSRLIGSWQGLREAKSKCQFLSWKNKFNADGRFEITFYSDKEKSKKIQTEGGIWKAHDGKNELKTDGVATAEIYEYEFIDDNTVKYLNIVRDPSAECQEDYEFFEYRIVNTQSN